MEDERERQQRDLQRATTLLETMSREELVDMLHDILFNERSDDTRKLSDWMAFQIIIQDETRDARRLLAQLGKDGRHHHRVDVSKTPGDIRHSPTITKQGLQGQDEEPGEDSSSITSFVTCPEAESFHCFSMCGTAKLGVSQPTDRIPDDAALAKAHAISGKSPKIEKRQASEKNKRGEDESALSRPEGNYLNHVGLYPASEFPLPVRHAILTLFFFLKAMGGDVASPVARPQVSGKTDRAAVKANAFETANQRGHRNLAEPYSRFENVRMEGWRADLLEFDSREALAQVRPMPAYTQVFDDDDVNKWRCYLCKLLFNEEQNVRDIDNGSSPCSYHPGHLVWNHPSFLADRYVWTCCHRAMPLAESESGTSETPGCQRGYHYGMEMPRRYMRDRLFTDDDDDLQSLPLPPWSNHLGQRLADLSSLRSPG